VDDRLAGIFPDKREGGRWRYYINGEQGVRFSPTHYATADAAKFGIFDALWPKGKPMPEWARAEREWVWAKEARRAEAETREEAASGPRWDRPREAAYEHLRSVLAAQACRRRWPAFDACIMDPTPENRDAARAAYRELAKVHHPDAGGSHEDFVALKRAYDEAMTACRRDAAADWRAA
jgi:hypothetical protein